MSYLEKHLIRDVCKGISNGIHHQSMTTASLTHNGTPDRYFDGYKRDLWIEFKQLSSMPRSGMVGGVGDKQGQYGHDQFTWMKRRHRWSATCGGPANVVGVIGLPGKFGMRSKDRLVVLQTTPFQWEEKSSIQEAISVKQLQEWIDDFCGASSAV